MLFIFQISYAETPKILIFGNTIRLKPHGEILPIAGPALEKYFTNNNINSFFTQDSSMITSSNLDKYSALVLLDVSEGVLNLEQQVAIENYFKKGHGILAIHASISAGKDWTWFQDLLGTKFVDHAPIQNGKVQVNSTDSHFTKLNQSWIQYDEWFNFTDPIKAPRDIVVLSDETSYQGGKMGLLHPIAWKLEKDNGQFFYTSMGHPSDLYTNGENDFLKMLLSAAQWVMNQ